MTETCLIHEMFILHGTIKKSETHFLYTRQFTNLETFEQRFKNALLINSATSSKVNFKKLLISFCDKKLICDTLRHKTLFICFFGLFD